MARLMLDAGLVVLAAFVSPFRQDRETVRELVGPENFVEVFVDCPLKICEQRDVKGVYKKAREGRVKNCRGLSSPFEVVEYPEVYIRTRQQSHEVSFRAIGKDH